MKPKTDNPMTRAKLLWTGPQKKLYETKLNVIHTHFREDVLEVSLDSGIFE